jgi:hypothetical protein
MSESHRPLEMPNRSTESNRYRCKCVSLHTYSAYVFASSWDVFLHVCQCGREHVNESLLPEVTALKLQPKTRRRRR